MARSLSYAGREVHSHRDQTVLGKQIENQISKYIASRVKLDTHTLGDLSRPSSDSGGDSSGAIQVRHAMGCLLTRTHTHTHTHTHTRTRACTHTTSCLHFDNQMARLHDSYLNQWRSRLIPCSHRAQTDTHARSCSPTHPHTVVKLSSIFKSERQRVNIVRLSGRPTRSSHVYAVRRSRD
jgi:hypothetical protein